MTSNQRQPHLLFLLMLAGLLFMNSCSTRPELKPVWIQHPGSAQTSSLFDDELQLVRSDLHHNTILAGTRLARNGKRNRVLFLSSHSVEGAKRWSLSLDLPGSEDRVSELLVDEQGHLYLIANSQQGGFITRIDQNGQHLWQRAFNSPIRQAILTYEGVLAAGDQLYDLASDGGLRGEHITQAVVTSLIRLKTGGIVLAGPGYVEKRTADLKRIWAINQPDSDGHQVNLLEAFTADNDQALQIIYVARNVPTPEGDQVRVYQLDAEGSTRWHTKLAFPTRTDLLSSPMLALSPAGNLIVIQSNTRERQLSALDSRDGKLFLDQALPGHSPVKALHALNDQLFIYGGKTLLQVNMEGAFIREFELPGQSPLTTGGATLAGDSIIVANSFSDEQMQLRTYAARFELD